MIAAALIVRFQHDKIEDGEPGVENWGVYQFVTLPRIGETIDAHHDNGFQTVIVRAVDHTALEQPNAHPDMKSWHREPTVRLTADWQWAD